MKLLCTLIILINVTNCLKAMEKPTSFTIENGSLVFTNAYWQERRKASAEAAITLVTHQQNEYNFKRLLNEERQAPDQARWSKIRLLLEPVAAYMSLDKDLRNKLVDAMYPDIDDVTGAEQPKEFTYANWLAIINPTGLSATDPAVVSQEAELQDISPSQTLHETLHADAQASLIIDVIPQEAPKEDKAIAQEPITAIEKATRAKSKQAKRQTTKHKKCKPQIKETAQKKGAPQETAVSEKEKLSDIFWTTLLENNIEQTATFLAAYKDKININENHRRAANTPLITAITEDYEAMTKLLLAQGANPDTQSTIRLTGTQGWLKITPLLLAVRTGKVETLKLLLEHKANPNIQAESIPSRKLEHALSIADKITDKETRIEVITLLLAHGANDSSRKVMHYDSTTRMKKELKLNSAEDRARLGELLKDVQKIKYYEKTIVIYSGSTIL